MQNKSEFTVSIVIPTYNTDYLLEKNLPTVLKTMENNNNKIVEIIVVDDGSKDKSSNTIKGKFPGVKLIKHKVNRGFSSAVNTGVRMAKGNLVALLNTDVVPSENFLESVLPHFENPKVFAVSLHETNYSWARGFIKDGFIGHESGATTDKVHISFWASGGSAVFRRSMWMDLGGMDEKLFNPAYWEDIDICYRAAKRGYGILWEPNAHVVHQHESTVSKLPQKYMARIRERNQLIFIWKNLTSPAITRKHVAGLISKIVRSPGYLLIVVKAMGKLPGILKARRKERKEAKLSDEAIFARFR